MAKKKEEKEIIIPAPKIRYLSVEVVGITPLLTHAMSAASRKGLKGKGEGKPKLRERPPSPQEQYESSKYKIGTGQKCGIPAIAFKRAMVSACRFVDGLHMAHAMSLFFVVGDLIEIKGKPNFREDVGRNKNGAAILIYRAEFKKWLCKLLIQYDEGCLSADQVANLLAVAGSKIGVGAFRAEKSGQAYGMFTIKHHKKGKR